MQMMSATFWSNTLRGVGFEASARFSGVVAPLTCFAVFEGLAGLLDPFLTVSGMTRIPHKSKLIAV
jgi:hypothetical protein